jgi:hypothetical protein
MHAAVFVGIRDGIAKVVVISKNFKTYSVPKHLRRSVNAYFQKETKFDGTMKDFLTRERIACLTFCSSWRWRREKAPR